MAFFSHLTFHFSLFFVPLHRFIKIYKDARDISTRFGDAGVTNQKTCSACRCRKEKRYKGVSFEHRTARSSNTPSSP